MQTAGIGIIHNSMPKGNMAALALCVPKTWMNAPVQKATKPKEVAANWASDAAGSAYAIPINTIPEAKATIDAREPVGAIEAKILSWSRYTRIADKTGTSRM